MSKAITHQHAGHYGGTPIDTVTLAHDARHLRRKMLTLTSGDELLVDLPDAVALEQGDVLVTEDGALIEIHAADEDLYEITAKDSAHHARLCWHIGNRHLPAQIEDQRILIARDHVIHDMLIGLGATVTDIVAPFSPERGAYHSHGTTTVHNHHHG